MTSKLSKKEQIHFLKRLSFLINAGISVKESIAALQAQTTASKKQIIFTSLFENISRGQYLYKSLEYFPTSFSPFTINLVKSGEENGLLHNSLVYIAQERKLFFV